MRNLLNLVMGIAIIALIFDMTATSVKTETTRTLVEEVWEPLEVENQPYVIGQPISRRNTRPRTEKITHVTIHNTANRNHWADTEFHHGFQDTTSRRVSFNYSVDDKQSFQHFPDDLVTFHAEECNDASLAIEVCMFDGIDVIQTLKNLNVLLDTLEARYPGLVIQTHKDCTSKNCPSWLPLRYYNFDVRKSNAYNPDKALAYINTHLNYAKVKESNTGIPAGITLAQALLESNVGESRLATENNNHFGIKCFSTSCRKGHCTNLNDDHHKDFFLKFSRIEDSYDAHSVVLKKKRYSKLFKLAKNDYEGWARGLKGAGYATNPVYAESLLGIIYQYGLHELD